MQQINQYYQMFLEPFLSLSPLYTVVLILFLSLLPLLDAHYNHRNEHPNPLSLAWLTSGLCGVIMLVLLSLSPNLQDQFTLADLLAFQVTVMLVLMLAHLVFFVLALALGVGSRKGGR